MKRKNAGNGDFIYMFGDRESEEQSERDRVEFLVPKRKLCLVLDLDHTLLHATISTSKAL